MSGNQKRFKVKKQRAFGVAMFLTVGLIAGIPMIVLGAVNGITAVRCNIPTKVCTARCLRR